LLVRRLIVQNRGRKRNVAEARGRVGSTLGEIESRGGPRSLPDEGCQVVQANRICPIWVDTPAPREVAAELDK